MGICVEKRKQIEGIFRRFLQNRVAAVRRLRISDLDINPFLIRILSHELQLGSCADIVRWLVNQRVGTRDRNILWYSLARSCQGVL